MRFVFLVEGKTEKESLKAFFHRWLEDNGCSGIGIDIFSHRNASRLFAEAPTRAADLLNGPYGNDIIAVFSLMDLYGAGIYPDDMQTVEERYEWGKREMEGRFPSSKYKHFFAVHETEAWLLSQPNHFPAGVKEGLRKHAKAPEKVNFDQPPAQRIGEQYIKHVGRGYGKVRDGSRILKDKKFDPSIAAGVCPYLKQLLDEMLRFAKEAKPQSRKTKR